MTQPDFLAFLISASLGALIGLERQWEDQHGEEGLQPKAGLRTFVLIALLGTASAFISKNFVPGFYGFGFCGLLFALFSRNYFGRDNKPPLGLTTLISTLLTFFIGSLVFWGQAKLSVILTVAMLLLLAGKRPIHHWSERFTDQDVRTALQFLAVTGIILPLAPNENYGPFGAFNPFKIWLMAVLVTGLGFFGYVSMRLFGTRTGLGTMGLLGGLTSSTATTLAFSRQSHDRPELSRGFAMAIVLACTIMLARVAILISAVSPGVLALVWPALALMCVPGLAYAAWYLLRKENAGASAKPPRLSNPLSLKIAIQFAALYAIVVLVSRMGEEWFGSAGITTVSFLSGLTDMDAIALSLGQMVEAAKVAPDLAARGIVIGALSNTLLKTAFTIFLGSRPLRLPVVLVFGSTMLLGIAALWWM